jgi:DNA polymerase-3 subunit delta
MPEIKPDKLFEELKKEILRPVYYLCGEENYRKKLAIGKIRQIINPDEFNFISTSSEESSISEILTNLNTPPVFSDKRLVILHQADKIKTDDKKAIIEYIKNPLETTCVIFESIQRKKTDSLLNACRDYGVKIVFYQMSEAQVTSWLKKYIAEKNFAITDDALKVLLDLAGTDLAILTSELDKIFIYTADAQKKEITYETVLNSIGFSKEENPFEISSYLLNKDIKNAIKCIEKLLNAGQEPMFLLSLMTNTLTKVLKVKRMTRKGLSHHEIFSQAGLNRFYEQDFISKAANFKSEDALLAIIEKSLEIESAFKSSATRDVKSALRAIILKAVSA